MEVMERSASASEDVAWKMGRIMLKYRPIAPKPLVAGAGAPSASLPAQACGRAKKRKGVKRGRKTKKLDVVTLPLMPVTPERRERLQAVASAFFWPAVSPAPAKAAGTVLVTVESVTEAWTTVGFCAGRDDELRRWLEAGDCPAFVSKAGEGDRIVWTNAAFRRMVVGGGFGAESPSSSSTSCGSTSWSESVPLGEAPEEDVRVVLVTRGLVPGENCETFTCMASVRYACGRRGKVSLAVPCDAWRLKDGGLAWRLDVKAALSLCAN